MCRKWRVWSLVCSWMSRQSYFSQISFYCVFLCRRSQQKKVCGKSKYPKLPKSVRNTEIFDNSRCAKWRWAAWAPPWRVVVPKWAVRSTQSDAEQLGRFVLLCLAFILFACLSCFVWCAWRVLHWYVCLHCLGCVALPARFALLCLFCLVCLACLFLLFSFVWVFCLCCSLILLKSIC